MDEPEDKCKEIIDPYGFGSKFLLKKIRQGSDDDGEWYEELHPFTVEPDDIVHTEGQCKGMADRKGCDEDQYLFPVFQ